MIEEILKTVIGGLIGVGGTILAQYIDFTSDETKKARKPLIGKWCVKWYLYEYNDLNKEKPLIEDSFHITRIHKNKFIAKVVDTPNVKYLIEGKISENIITYDFHGISNLGIHGTGVLTASLSKTKMTGLWIQVDNNAANIIGHCIWEKI